MRQTECGVHMDDQGRRKLGQVRKLSGTVTKRRPWEMFKRRIGVRASESLAETRNTADTPRGA